MRSDMGSRLLHRAYRAISTRIFPPKPKPLILLYHRVAETAIDPWGNAVSPHHFEQQLDVLHRLRQPLPLADFVRGLSAATLPDNAVSVTFDDGYLDNLSAAKPCLAAADVPATVFLATGYLDQAGEFWWDEIERLALCGCGPQVSEVTIGKKTVRFDGSYADSPLRNAWRGWDPPRTVREQTFLAIYNALRPMESQARESAMEQVRKAFTCSRSKDRSVRPMTTDEVRLLISDGLVSIGAHTVTHPMLTEIDRRGRSHEIAASKRDCEALAGVEVGAFAYPFGNLDDDVRVAVREAGFTHACSTRFAPAIDPDAFALPRIHVPDLDGDAFTRLLHYASAAG